MTILIFTVYSSAYVWDRSYIDVLSTNYCSHSLCYLLAESTKMKNHSPISEEALKHHGREMLMAKFAMKYTQWNMWVLKQQPWQNREKSLNLLNILKI